MIGLGRLVKPVGEPTTDWLSLTEGPVHVSDEELQILVRRLVGTLRERQTEGLLAALAPILEERNRAVSDVLSHDGASILKTYDRLILAALSNRYDALDLAISKTSIAVAEIDGAGLISYANEALKKMVQDPTGRDFASLFGPRSRDVRNALSSGRRQTLRLDLQRGNLPSVHLRGEIGPLSDEYNRLGAYALLLGVEGENARFDALPDGILRLNQEGSVVFASKRAKELFGDSNDLLRGRPVGELFRNSTGSFSQIDYWSNSADGHKELTEILPLDGREAMPIRLTVVPSFDTAESRSGWVLTIVPIASELAQAELQRLLSTPNCEPEDLVRGIMSAIRRVLPYDLATFGVYTEDLKYHNTLVVYPQPEWPWTTAWFPLGSGAREFLLGGHTWGDIQTTTKEVAPDVEGDPVFEHILESGLTRFVTLPITGGGQEVRAALTLLSKEAGRFDGSEIALMRELGVEKALLIAEANIVRQHDDRIRVLEERLAVATEYRKLADALAQGVADCFGWDYVAIFAVDRRDNLFRLISQCNRTASPDVRDTYTQALTEGLLGAAFRANAARAEPNIEAGVTHGYKPVVSGRRSALAMPIRVVQHAAKSTSDEIEWLLSVESSQRNAFQGPGMEALKKLLALCQGVLRQRWQKAVQTSLLDAVEQAVIIVDRAGKIRLTNRWANALLCRPSELLLGRMLADFGAQESDRELLRSTSLLAQDRVTLSADGAVIVPTLASRISINDDYRHQLLLLTDLREQEQQSNWSYLEQTVNEVAQNARLSLMLADGLVRDATKELVENSSVSRVLEAALRHLGKADITYERLANTLAVRQEPDRPAEIFDALEILRQAVADLPDDDVWHCNLTDLVDTKRFKAFMVSGWPDQLSFAFRSLLGNLLLQRPSDEKISITLCNTSGGNLRILFALPASSKAPGSERPAGRIEAAEQKAREAASLAPDAVALAVRRHHGEFQIDAEEGSTLTFKIELQPVS
jgi:PAS domain-containing protein